MPVLKYHLFLDMLLSVTYCSTAYLLSSSRGTNNTLFMTYILNIKSGMQLTTRGYSFTSIQL